MLLTRNLINSSIHREIYIHSHDKETCPALLMFFVNLFNKEIHKSNQYKVFPLPNINK